MHTLSYGGMMAIQTLKDIEIENLFTSLGLSQIISEPANFEPNKNPSCIDLIATRPTKPYSRLWGLALR